MKKMIGRIVALAVLLGLSIVASSCIILSPATSTLEITNSSNYSILHVYVRESGTSTWSADQTGTATIYNNEVYSIDGLNPGTYDVRLYSSVHLNDAYYYDVELNRCASGRGYRCLAQS